MKPLSRTLALTLSLCSLATPGEVLAGKPIYGYGADIPSAMESAQKAVEDAARKTGRCVSRYPTVETCTQVKDGAWRCQGVRANHKGSCK